MVQVRRVRAAVRRKVRVAVLTATALVATLAVAAVASSVQPASGLDLGTPCPVGTVVPAGYECTALVSKTTGQVVGPLFVKLGASTLTLASPLFDARLDTGFAGAKLCVDDDADPRRTRVSCTGGASGTTVNKPYTIGTGRNQVKPAWNGAGSDPFEEVAGRYEYLLEGSALGIADPPVPGLTTYTALVGDAAGVSYEEFAFGFSQGTSTVEAFFELEPAGVRVLCDTSTTFAGSTTVPTYTVRIEGGCASKQVLYAASTGSAGPTQFVDLRPARPGDTKMLFLEKIDWAPVAAGQPLRELRYDDVYVDVGSAEPVLMRTCLSDPRAGGAFDIRSEVTVATAGTVLPGSETSCLVDQELDIRSGQVFVTHVVFNVGDGMRQY